MVGVFRTSMGAGSSAAAHFIADASTDIDSISITAVQDAPETLPVGSIAIWQSS